MSSIEIGVSLGRMFAGANGFGGDGEWTAGARLAVVIAASFLAATSAATSGRGASHPVDGAPPARRASNRSCARRGGDPAGSALR